MGFFDKIKSGFEKIKLQNSKGFIGNIEGGDNKFFGVVVVDNQDGTFKIVLNALGKENIEINNETFQDWEISKSLAAKEVKDPQTKMPKLIYGKEYTIKYNEGKVSTIFVYEQKVQIAEAAFNYFIQK